MPNISEREYDEFVRLRSIVHEKAVVVANKKVKKRKGDYVIRFFAWLNNFSNRVIDESKNQAWKDAYDTARKDYETSQSRR